jgi:hypothetical protein
MTKTERDLLTECETLAVETGQELRDLISDAEIYWRGSGRLVEPRRWRSRAAACRRLLARMPDVIGGLRAWAGEEAEAY